MDHELFQFGAGNESDSDLVSKMYLRKVISGTWSWPLSGKRTLTPKIEKLWVSLKCASSLSSQSLPYANVLGEGGKGAALITSGWVTLKHFS